MAERRLRFERGCLRVGRLKGVPLRLHWTLPIGAVLFCGEQGGPVAWGAFAALILVHELGHAALVRRYRLHVIDVTLHGAGGECHYSGEPTEMQRTLIAWGGVVAQAMVLVIACLALAPHGPPSPTRDALVTAFIDRNLAMILLNLLPFRPLDGGEAWKIVGVLARRSGRRSRLRAEAAAIERQLRSSKEERHPGQDKDLN